MCEDPHEEMMLNREIRDLKKTMKEIHDRVADFDKQCNEEEYTDTDEAWSIFRWILNVTKEE